MAGAGIVAVILGGFLIGALIAAASAFSASYAILATAAVLGMVLLVVGIRTRPALWAGMLVLFSVAGYALATFAFKGTGG